ncbi:MAG: hypothetical protein ACTSUE_07385 [Promethearchaeota archaeon]
MQHPEYHSCSGILGIPADGGLTVTCGAPGYVIWWEPRASGERSNCKVVPFGDDLYFGYIPD